jgi:hyperosmotically inducible protein
MARNAVLARALPLFAAVLLTVPSSHAVDDCNDGWITSKIKTKMLGNTMVGTFKMNVDTEMCVVTLTGCVDTEAQRAEATKVAKSIKKVKSVDNRLSLCPAKSEDGSGKDSGSGEDAKGDDGGVDDCADAMITAEVKSMLMGTTGLDAYRINVDTEKCVVTLNGCVEDPARKAKAEEMARKAAGVRGVKNALKTCPKE